MKNKASQDLVIADEAYKNKDYIKSYSVYKSIYREYNLQQIIPRLVDIAYKKLNKTKIKFTIISNLIDIGFINNNEIKILTELVYLKLKLLREYEKFNDFHQFYFSTDIVCRDFIFTQIEYFHYLLKTENFK